MTPKEEAEKAWRDYEIRKMGYYAGAMEFGLYSGHIHPIEDYKDSLREAIEKRIKDVPKGFTYPMSAQELLELIDEVTPKTNG